MEPHFYGYERTNGRPGIRNYVAIVAAMDNVNPIVGSIAAQVSGTVPITDLYGRKMIGYNYEMQLKAMTAQACNPNVGGVVVVSLHRPSADRFAQRIAACGVPVETVVYQECGSIMRCIEAGVTKAVQFVRKCSAARKREFPLGELVMGVECGGSDPSSGLAGNPSLGVCSDMLIDRGGSVVLSETGEVIGAEHILARQAVNEAVARKLYDAIAAIEEMSRFAGVPDIRRGNPSIDNINAGLSTLAEKSLGSIKKGGTRPLKDVIGYCDPVPATPGYYFMNTPSPACESMTGLAAGGAQLIVFNTGLGNPAGNPVAPTLKMTANAVTAEKCADDFDILVTDVLTKGTSLAHAGTRVFDTVLHVANGMMTVGEILRTYQSTVGRRGASF